MISQHTYDFVEEFLKSPLKNLIKGDFVEASEGKTLEVENPSTKKIIANVAKGDAKDIDKAANVARFAFDNIWSKTKPNERQRLLFKLADLIEANAEKFALLESLDVGMPVMAAKMGLLPHIIAGLRYNAGWATKLNGETRETSLPGEWHTFTYREPMGVAGLITPWNVPLAIALNKMSAALAAGCTIVLKPAEQTPLSAIYLGQLINEVGFPEGVVNIVNGLGIDAGAAMVEHPLIDKISFTGSTIVGKNIIAKAAQTLKRTSMELGGKSPVIIFPDCDIEKAIDAVAKGIFGNTGQVCAAGSRLFAHKEVFDKIVEGIAQKAAKLKVGKGTDYSTEIGPVVSNKQLGRVLEYIESGRQQGAEVLVGGNAIDGDGYFIAPTVFTNTNKNMKIVQEEIFGPVLCATTFDDETIDDIANMGNNTEYGLNSVIFTRDISKAHKLARRLKAGNVRINTSFAMDPSMPFGGYKQSGFGRENGREGIESFTELKSVAIALD